MKTKHIPTSFTIIIYSFQIEQNDKDLLYNYFRKRMLDKQSSNVILILFMDPLDYELIEFLYYILSGKFPR